MPDYRRSYPAIRITIHAAFLGALSALPASAQTPPTTPPTSSSNSLALARAQLREIQRDARTSATAAAGAVER